MKIWYFYGQYKANGLGTIEKSYNIFDLSHMSIVAAHFQKKNKRLYIHSGVQTKKVEKYFENKVAEPYLEPYKISVMGRFCENAMVKNHIIDV